MVKLAESIGRVVMAGRDFTRLAAYTTRVNQLIKTIDKYAHYIQWITSSKISSNILFYT